MPRRIAIIGAGILGATLAWSLTRRGAEVTVFDAGEPQAGRPSPGMATAASFAWINASSGNPPAYRALRLAAIAAWHRLGQAVPTLAPNWCGGLMWDAPEAGLRAFAAQEDCEDYPLRLVARDGAALLEPGLSDPPALALHAPAEGMVEPLAVAWGLLAASGASLRVRHRAGLVERDGRVAVLGPQGAEGFDNVVLAAGVGTPALLADLGLTLPQTAPPGLLAISEPVPPVLNGLVMMPGLHLRQRADGALLIGEDFTGTDPGEAAQALAEALIGRAAQALRVNGPLRLAHYTLGLRPTPGDGFPAVGPIGGIYLMLTHSGVTLAPGLAEMAAEELLTGARHPLLAPYHPGRFAAMQGGQAALLGENPQ